jgi:hypothetical protein
MGATRALQRLEDLRSRFGGDAGERKATLLRTLASTRLPTAKAVARLHEVLCFLRAHPDDASLLAQVGDMLDRFHLPEAPVP